MSTAGVTKVMINKSGEFLKYYLATALLAVAFFSHFFFPNPDPDVKAAKDAKIAIEESIELAKEEIVLLSAKLNNPEIDRLNFEILEHERNLKKASSNYHTVKASNKVFGFRNIHKFLWSFGLGLIISILSLRIMYMSHFFNDFKRRRANSIMGLMGCTIGGYFFAWVFYPDNDLSYSVYMTLLVSIGVMASILGYYLSKTMYVERKKITEFKSRLVNRLFSIRNDVKGLAKVAIKNDLHNEAYQDAVKEKVDEIDNNIINTAADELVD